MRASMEVHAPKKGFSDAGPKALAVVQAPGTATKKKYWRHRE